MLIMVFIGNDVPFSLGQSEQLFLIFRRSQKNLLNFSDIKFIDTEDNGGLNFFVSVNLGALNSSLPLTKESFIVDFTLLKIIQFWKYFNKYLATHSLYVFTKTVLMPYVLIAQ